MTNNMGAAFCPMGMGHTANISRREGRAPVAAVFIHAGAGYHSSRNERYHLEACSEAARVAMRFLRTGADSTLAVEAAIKYLEDKEITNAGFGSNLNINGVVEGDATIVDHLGRSGACGAVPGIENPISLAKLIRDASIKPLSLCRVSPNILVGTGAKKFAEENGIPSVMNEMLISRNAKCRFEQWYRDLVDAETRATTTPGGDGDPRPLTSNQPISQGFSPQIQSDKLASAEPVTCGNSVTGDLPAETGDGYRAAKTHHPPHPAPTAGRTRGHDSTRTGGPEDEGQDVDMVNDTVGAIAIDFRGHIAAGSSSGGIGMKHEGRVGPAALVGIGTAVIPADLEDEDGVSVAAVTSGTGEHMATSFASHKCAERLYHCSRRGRNGQNVAEYDDDAVMESFVTVDFMGHPGVKSQPTPGAIGVMAVKQTNSGYYFYFAHNTESFALASMASTEAEPLCTMSRANKAPGVVRGGRKIRLE